MTRRRPRPTTYAALQRAADALASARASGADPWRVAELRARHDALLEACLDAGPDVALALVSDGPRARTAEPALPLAWLDQSVDPATRRGGGS
jgi:hypothetical protein